MKKLIFIAAILLASACSTPHYILGMTEAEFLRQNKSASPESQTATASVYRLYYHNGHGQGTQFFYFQNGVLVQVDRGQPKPDIVIDKTVHHQ